MLAALAELHCNTDDEVNPAAKFRNNGQPTRRFYSGNEEIFEWASFDNFFAEVAKKVFMAAVGTFEGKA